MGTIKVWSLGKKAIISTSIIVLFPGHKHLLTSSADDPTLCLIIAGGQARLMIKVKGDQHWCLAGGYDLEIGHF